MNSTLSKKQPVVRLAVMLAALGALVTTPPQSKALDTLTNGVVAYWPMDAILGCVIEDKGPNGFDLKPLNNKVVVPFNGANITVAVNGGPHASINGLQNGTNALVTSISQSTVLGYIAPVTSVSQLTNLSLPPLNLPNWTISFWLKAAQGGGNRGNRMFAIAETPLGNGPNLLWDLTQNNNSNPDVATSTNQFGHFRRQTTTTINGLLFTDDNNLGNQVTTTNLHVFDNQWHNVTMIATMITNLIPVTITNNQFMDPPNGPVNLGWTAGLQLDTVAPNAANQINTNQYYSVQRATSVSGPYTEIANGGNGSTYSDNTPTNANAFYRISKPAIREQQRILYVDGVPVLWIPDDSIEQALGPGAFESHPSSTGARYRTNGWFFADTIAFGGFVRAAGEGGFVNASFSDAAVWNRALSQAELNAYIADGITNSSVFTPALAANISAEYPAAVTNDTDLLSWTATKPPATLNLTPGIGSVDSISCVGNGSTNATITSNTVYSLVATRGGNSVTSSVTVIAVSNVTANWRYIDSFTYLNDGYIVNQGNWLNPPRGPATPSGAQPFVVHTAVDGNKVGSFDGMYNNPNDTSDPLNNGFGGIAGRALGSLKNSPGQTNTLFFRFYIDPAATNIDGIAGQLLINYRISVQDLGIGDPGFNYGGPGFVIIQNNPAGGPIDLTAPSGHTHETVTPGGYNYLTDPTTGNTNGLTVGKVYSVWIDVINNMTNYPAVVGGVVAQNTEQTNAALYRVWLQCEDWPQRTNLFSGITCTNTYGGVMNGTNYPTGWFLSNRDYGVNDQQNLLLGPTPVLNYVALYMLQIPSLTTPQATNGVRFDDFFISKLGQNSTTPVSAGSFNAP